MSGGGGVGYNLDVTGSKALVIVVFCPCFHSGVYRSGVCEFCPSVRLVSAIHRAGCVYVTDRVLLGGIRM